MSLSLAADRDPLARLPGDPVGSQSPGRDTEPAAQAKHGVPDSPGAQRSPPSRPHGEGSPLTQESVFLISLTQANLRAAQEDSLSLRRPTPG